jgi:hypothetical protein
MFTLAISFLIFASSSFQLIGSLIGGEIVSIFGADLYAAELNANNGNYLN